MYITIQGFTGVYMGVHSNTGPYMVCVTIRVTIRRETICELP